jgi:hypothetical protein
MSRNKKISSRYGEHDYFQEFELSFDQILQRLTCCFNKTKELCFIGTATYKKEENTVFNLSLGVKIAKYRALIKYHDYEIYNLKKLFINSVITYSSIDNSESFITYDESENYILNKTDKDIVDKTLKVIKKRLGRLNKQNNTAGKLLINSLYTILVEIKKQQHIRADYNKKINKIIASL